VSTSRKPFLSSVILDGLIPLGDKEGVIDDTLVLVVNKMSEKKRHLSCYIFKQLNLQGILTILIAIEILHAFKAIPIHCYHNVITRRSNIVEFQFYY